MDFGHFDRLNQMVNVADVFDIAGAKHQKDDGGKQTYSCPFHTDESPSLMLDVETGRFNCFACDFKGTGAYSAAKYYLSVQSSDKVGMRTVFEFLLDIEPSIEVLRPYFKSRAIPQYEYGTNKRREYMRRTNKSPLEATYNVAKKNLDDNQFTQLIDAIMINSPLELKMMIVGSAVKNKKELEEGSDVFKSFLEVID